MHICFVPLDYPDSTGGGGVGNQAQLLAKELIRLGHRVSVIAYHEKDSPNIFEDEGVRVRRVSASNLHWILSKIPFLKIFTKAVKELEIGWAVFGCLQKIHLQEPIDIVEGTETGMLIARIFFHDAPLLIRLHGEEFTFQQHTPGGSRTIGVWLARLLQRRAISKADGLISPSRVHGDEVSRELRGKHKPIFVIPNVICLDKLIYKKSFESLKKKVVLYCGRIQLTKGVLVLLESFSQVLKKHPDLVLVIAGAEHPTISKQKLMKLITDLNIESKVHLLGHVPGSKLPKLYAEASFCVLPTYYETFGLAALEPMIFGKPIISTTAGGVPEIIINEETGLLVSPGNALELTQAMERLLSDKALYDRLVSTAQRHVVKFGVQNLIKQNEDFFLNLCNVAKPPEGGAHIFLSPHYDDVVFSCGGAINRLKKEKKLIWIFTVFSQSTAKPGSYFVSHLWKKWHTAQPQTERLSEEKKAMKILGNPLWEAGGFFEAPYRKDAQGRTLYASYEELSGNIVADDLELKKNILNKMKGILSGVENPVLYCPLALGNHVDHQMLNQIGNELYRDGYKVWFYEDWPYVESYRETSVVSGWGVKEIPIDINTKVRAASCYVSQLPGVGGGMALSQRLRKFFIKSNGNAQEKIWQIAGNITKYHPFLKRKTAPLGKFHDFNKFLKTFHRMNLEEILPLGKGCFLDVGCGSGRYREVIEKKGYQWVGLDKQWDRLKAPVIQGDMNHLPIKRGSLAGAVLWQVLEYTDTPDEMIHVVSESVGCGGVLCGSVSFLEPVHGKTSYNLSPLSLKKLLSKEGFADIQIRPGLNGFTLMLWTWLQRYGGKKLEAIAPMIAGVLFIPVAGAVVFISYIRNFFGFGTEDRMQWVSEGALLEFAGQIVFCARKKANLKSE